MNKVWIAYYIQMYIYRHQLDFEIWSLKDEIWFDEIEEKALQGILS